MSMLPKSFVIWLSALCITNTTLGQTTAIPATPFEAKIWLKRSRNSYVENELGQVVQVNIEYVPRVFVVGDLEVFPHLEWLRINYSGRFYDRHMSGIARLKGLKKLTIRRCDEITEATLAVLRFLPNLEELELIDLQSLFSLAPLSQCKSIRKLTFSENGHFEFTGLERLASLPNLEELVLEKNNSLQDRHLRFLKSFKNLLKLSLRENKQITDAGLTILSSVPNLKYLDLSNCPLINGTFLVNVSDGIESLLLHNADVTDEGVKYLGRFRAVKELRLDQNSKITGNSLFVLEKCESLETLDLSGLPVSKSHFERMVCFERLRKLILSGCEKITGDAVGLLVNFSECRRIDSPDLISLAHFSNLKTLVLTQTRIKTEGIVHLQQLEKLESVDLSNCKWIDDESVAAVGKIKSLKKVYLNDLPRLTDESLHRLGALPELREVYLSNNFKITGGGFSGFSENCPLTTLSMNGLDSLTPSGLHNLVRLQKLENLVVRCKKLTNEHFLAMMGMPGLKKFALDNKDYVDRDVYRKWVNSLPSYGKQSILIR